MPEPRTQRRAAAVALVLAASAALAGCTHAEAKSDVSATAQASAETLAWPKAVDPAQADGPFYVVWTAVEETSDGPAKLQPEIDKLSKAGYQVLPWDPSCQSGAEEQLAGLTGYKDPLAVGVAFTTARDAGVFDTLYHGLGGSTKSVTQGTYTCAK
jgi:hypothetical protein